MRVGTILAALLAAFPAFAQIDLATTRDGSTLYFTLVTPTGGYEIRRWTRETGVTVFAGPDRAVHNLSGTQITYAGSVLYHAEPSCSVGTGPGFDNCASGETVISIPTLDAFRVSGFLLISPNGRYGVFTPYKTGALWVDWFTGEQIEVDFGQYGYVPRVYPGFPINQHAVGNDGSFLISVPLGLRVWSKTGERFFPLRDYLISATISGDGTTAAVSPYDPCCMTSPTYVYDLPSGKQSVFALGVSMSDDGKTVAYLSADPTLPFFPNPQAIVARPDRTGARRIGADVPEGLHALLLSGDGRILYAVTGNFSAAPSRILRYEVETGAVKEIRPVP